MTPTVISIGKRKVCRCAERCARAVEFRNEYDEVLIVLCEKEASAMCFHTLDTLLKAPVIPPLRIVHAWTDKEKAKLKNMLAQGMTQGQMGIALGRSTSVVRKKIAHMRKRGEL